MKETFGTRVKKDLKQNWILYLMLLPVLLYFILFFYKPMYGALIAFQDYRPAKDFGTDWVGFKHFIRFFQSPFLGRILRNTITISVLMIVFGFPGSIFLAIMINEIKGEKFKAVSQSCMHLPHFVSLVVVCGLVRKFCLSDGLFNDIIVFFGGEASPLLQRPELYKLIYVLTDIWQSMGWNSLIFVAALSGIDTQLYDAAKVDGAGKLSQIIHVTIPGIMPTIVVMFIMNVGNIMSLGYEKTLLLYNESIYETSDIISSYVYRIGMLNKEWSYSAAVGIFNSVVNIILVIIANKLSKKFTDNSLW